MSLERPARRARLPLSLLLVCVLAAAPAALSQTHEDPDLDFEVYVDGLEEPVAMAFIDGDDMLVLERTSGRVVRVRDGQIERTVLRLDVDTNGRRGGLGLALHPDFDTTPQAFVFYSYAEGGAWIANRIIRAEFNGTRLTKPRTLFEFMAETGDAADGEQNGGALAFGPDGLLYAFVGALGRSDPIANRVEQNDAAPASGVGAILRVDADGSVPTDNPFVDEADSTLHMWFGYGVRDGVGLDFDPVTGDPWISERGPDGWDELNRVFSGFNGGWTKIVGPDGRDVSLGSGGATFDKDDLVRLAGSSYRDPTMSWVDSIGVGALAFLDTRRYGKALENQLVVGDDSGNLYLFELLKRSKKRKRLQLRGPVKDRVADDDGERARNLWARDLGAVSALQLGPDGALYVADRAGGRILRMIDKVDASARYRVTFDATWDATTHPDPGFPAGPHFSGLVGATHGDGADFWEAGTTASDGIKNMAETGSKSPLNSEIQAAIDAGTAELLLSGGGIGLSPGDVGIEFDITSDRSLVTLVSMLAPSPDWFVGVDSLDLIVNGDWTDLLIVDLFPYDAGTDSGTTYTSANESTSPRQAIARISGAPFLVDGSVPKVGTFKFERID